MNILVPSTPARLRITQTMIEDFLINPVIGMRFIFGEQLDAFQRAAVKILWWTPRVIDSSGLGSSKTRRLWLVSNLRALLMPGHVAGVYYPTWDTGKKTYWRYFTEIARKSPIYAAQCGQERVLGITGKSGEIGKAEAKGPSCFEFNYKCGSRIYMPAPGFLQDARSQAGMRFNDLCVDEWTKVEASGSKGIGDQLIGRTQGTASWNKEHPIHCNHHLFLATAEDMGHPSYKRQAEFEQEVRAGNPEYFTLSFNAKHYSGLKFSESQTFRDRFREDRTLKDLKKDKGPSGFLQEGLGIWSRFGRGLYTSKLIQQGHKLGTLEHHPMLCSRHEDSEGAKAHYFLGIDPAKADDKKADDGAMVVLRVIPLLDENQSDVRMFRLGWCWAYRVRRANASQWAAIIHRKHRHFGFSGVMMDPGGGGIWIRPCMAESQQNIAGVDTLVRPIACLEDEQGMMILGDFILSMFKPSDIRVQQVWGDMDMRGMDKLIDIGHTELVEGLQHGIAWPVPLAERDPAEKEAWSAEKREAARLVELIGTQLQRIYYKTNDDGTTFFTRQNARQFAAKGKKDFAYAAMMAYLRFIQWVRSGQHAVKIAPEDECMAGG